MRNRPFDRIDGAGFVLDSPAAKALGRDVHSVIEVEGHNLVFHVSTLGCLGDP
jgi:hypothetical protein